MYEIYFDGSCKDKEAVSCVVLKKGKKVLKEYIKKTLGTSNTAEWVALLMALAVAKHIKKRAKIMGDSQLVIYQLLGKYRVKDEKLKKYHRVGISLYEKVKEKVEIVKIDRKENLADKAIRRLSR